MPSSNQARPRRAATRTEQIAALHREHAARLEQRVARRASTDRETIKDACSFAWLQLLTHPAVELGPPHAAALGWLTQTATREAWRLAAARARERPLDQAAIEHEQRTRGQLAPAADRLAAQHSRLALVAAVPERPRRFLLRLALGYAYREIAAAERVSHTTTNRQIASAKRHLRDLDACHESRCLPRPRIDDRVDDDRLIAAA
jgi:DNA-directed RNA polymerase specialized sigma24 family protein